MALPEPLFVANRILTFNEINEFIIGVLMFRAKMVIYLKFFITITKHIGMYMVEKLERVMLSMYYMGD